MDIFQEIKEEMKDLYLRFNGPIVIMFSGGKDSSLVLTEWWFALKEIPKEQLTKTVHVICGNTMVETPLMTAYVKETMKKIQAQAEIDGLPIKTHLVEPEMKNRYFFKMLGRGNLPPTPTSDKNRWCTFNLKQIPTQSVIEEIIKEAPIHFSFEADVLGKQESIKAHIEQSSLEEHYNVLMCLGVRNEESARRRNSIKKHSFGDDSKFAKHATYKNILCYHPIKYVTNDELLFYFLELGTLPFGVTLTELERQYGTSFAECGLKHSNDQDVSCGVSGSRQGCWICPLSKPDDPMLIGLIEEGYKSYRYLLDWKKLHIAMRNDIRYREFKRRVKINQHLKGLKQKEIKQTNLFQFDAEQKAQNYFETYQRAESEGYDPGGFTIEARRILLEYLLYIQEKMNTQLIEEEEVQAILQAWVDTDNYVVSREELRPQPFVYDGPVEFDEKGNLKSKKKEKNGNPYPVFFVDIEFNMEEDELIHFLKKRQSITGRSIFCFPSYVEYEKERVVWNKATFVVCNKDVATQGDAKVFVWRWLGWLDEGMSKEKRNEACRYLILSAISEGLANKYKKLAESKSSAQTKQDKRAPMKYFMNLMPSNTDTTEPIPLIEQTDGQLALF